jgi:hypothetical protein
MKSRMLFTVGLLVVAVVMSFAQTSGQATPHPGKIGLGLDGITGSPNVLLKYFFSNQLAGQVIVGFDLNAPGGTAPAGQTKVNGLTFRGGLSFLYHLTRDQVSPYVGVEGIFQTAKQAGIFVTQPDSKNSMTAGLVLGAEYFMHERFSLGIKHTLGVDVQLKRDIPQEETDVTFASFTVVTGRFYFN